MIFTEELLHLHAFRDFFACEQEESSLAGGKETTEIFTTRAANLGEITSARKGVLDGTIVKIGGKSRCRKKFFKVGAAEIPSGK